jgi:hypothetical protein
MIIAGVSFVAAGIEFLWDIKKYGPAYTQLQCDRLTYAHGFFNMITFLVMNIFCYLLPSWGIYYAYYYRNKDNFKPDAGDWDRRHSDFDDLRSELVD